MDERKRQVLDAIIKDYIETAEPVGSRAVAKKYDLGVSPATIRNEMSDLEDLGYIEQPHTSAGRRPSDKGYRYYVDYLMQKEELLPEETEFIKQSLCGEITELEEGMKRAVKLLSKLTNYPTIAVMPQKDNGRVEKIQLVFLNETQGIAVVLSDTGIINHSLISFPQPMNPLALSDLEYFLNSKLAGLKFEEITYAVLRDIVNKAPQHKELVAVTLDLLEKVLNTSNDEKVFTGGALDMLSQPEFQNIETCKKVLELFEHKENVVDILQPLSETNETVIAIGSELPYEGMEDYSIVVAPYGKDKKNGYIGVLGPTRMSYAKTVSLVNCIAEELSKLVDKTNIYIKEQKENE
ncbi:MAG: heat-inducible transcription repressor HrcA [Firmicutes bacterium]|nr:heat-inducible transcription repressor HrcA [Bacillota bacterium]